MKNNLDYSTTIPHHDDPEAAMDVSITAYEDGPIVFIKLNNNEHINLNRTEIETLLALLDLYDNAQKIMEGLTP